MAFDPHAPISSPVFVNGTPDWVKPLIENASRAHNIPTMVLSALIKQESGFNVNAQSPVGAQGIAQFMPDTAKGRNVNPWDPSSAINGAAKYLADGMKKFGKIDLALAAYNAGSGAVMKYGGIPPYKETQNYVKNILGMAGQPHETANQTAMTMISEIRKQQQAAAKPQLSSDNPFQSSQGGPDVQRGSEPQQPTFIPNYSGFQNIASAPPPQADIPIGPSVPPMSGVMPSRISQPPIASNSQGAGTPSSIPMPNIGGNS